MKRFAEFECVGGPTVALQAMVSLDHVISVVAIGVGYKGDDANGEPIFENEYCEIQLTAGKPIRVNATFDDVTAMLQS